MLLTPRAAAEALVPSACHPCSRADHQPPARTRPGDPDMKLELSPCPAPPAHTPSTSVSVHIRLAWSVVYIYILYSRRIDAAATKAAAASSSTPPPACEPEHLLVSSVRPRRSSVYFILYIYTHEFIRSTLLFDSLFILLLLIFFFLLFIHLYILYAVCLYTRETRTPLRRIICSRIQSRSHCLLSDGHIYNIIYYYTLRCTCTISKIRNTTCVRV